MKTILCFLGFCLLLPLCARAEDEKIDPATYICAELVAASLTGQPAIYESLQLDGYNAAKTGQTSADAANLGELLLEVNDSCTAMPTEKALDHWKMARQHFPVDSSSPWRADKTLCGDYSKDPDNGSGFIIWLDAYNRAKTGKDASILKDQATLDSFLEKCNASPKRLIIDVLNENAK